MSRIVAACLLLLSLGFASCSSASSANELGIDPSIDTSHHNPHPRGLSGAGFSRYWLGNNSDSPYAAENADRGFWSIFFGTGESFGEATYPVWRPTSDLYPRSDAHHTAHKMLLNEDFNDPYAQ